MQHSKPKQFAYLVQCRKHWDYLFSLQSDNSDLYVLTFKQPLRYPNGITSIYYPESSWNTGRNKLYEVASQKEYEYFIFLDDDVLLSYHFSKKVNPFRYLEAALNYYKPAAMAGNYDHITRLLMGGNIFSHTVKYHDACVSAIHREVAKKVLPYETQWDSECWWRSQYVFCVLLGYYFPSSALGLPNLDVKNMMHDAYPNANNDYKVCLDYLKDKLGKSERLQSWEDTVNKNDGEFIPLDFYLQTGE